MKHLILIALFIVTGIATTQAQVKDIQYSDGFTEPANGFRKVIQLTNGNTFLFSYAGKGGMDVYVFNKMKKLVAQKNSKGEHWLSKELKVTKVAGLYEIGGKPVVFIQQVIKRIPRLVRITFNPTTGDIVNEKVISTLQKHHAGMKYAMVWGGIEEPAFHVQKSPVSDDYAIINFNSISPESDERIQVTYYSMVDGHHKIQGKAFYEGQGYKYVNYVASYLGENTLYLCAYGFNKVKGDISDSRMIISKLKKGETSFTHKKMEFSDDFQDTRGIMTYNPGSNLLQLLSLTYIKKKNNMWKSTQTTTYLPLMIHIDPSTLQIIKAKPLTHEYANVQVQERLKEDKPFNGLPQYMVVNNDYTTSIISESIYKLSDANTRITIETHLGNIAISEYDMSGKETLGYAAKKSQKAFGDLSVFSLTDRVSGKWTYKRPMTLAGDNTAFFSFNYIDTKNGRYLIFNDFFENYGKKGGDKITKVDKASEMVTMYYELDNGFFKKRFFYETPDDDRHLKFTDIQSADFNKKTNTYATLMVNRVGKKKTAHVAWITFN